MKKQTTFFSFGIIFKNDIRCLERCLKSLQPVRDAVPCELVMADTGSSDGSREVAEQYADILFDFAWCDDFSAARNAVMDRCSGVWYFSLDTDEWLDENVTELIQFSKAKNLKRDFAAYTIRNYQSQDLGKTGNYLDFSAIRIMRLCTGVRYNGCIHETWSPGNGTGLAAMMLGETLVHHDGYVYQNKAAMEVKKDRNLKLLKKKIEQNPNDFQTLVECIDGTKAFDDVSMEYSRCAIEGIRQKWENWEKSGPTVFRNAVSAASMRKKPELMEWAEEAIKRFPNSIYINVDVAYYSFRNCWDKKDYADCARWGELYRNGIKDYQTQNFDQSETLRGALEYASPYWQRRLYILLTETYLNLEKYADALEILKTIDGRDLDELAQVTYCTNMLLRLHRMSALDTQTQLVRLWDDIENSRYGDEARKSGKKALINAAASAFSPKYREDERTKDGFLRHSYTMLTCLEGKCSLGLAAAIMESSDSTALTEMLSRISGWDEVPIHVLAHALECGASFPTVNCHLYIEEMDCLADRLSQARYDILALSYASGGCESYQCLCWRQELIFAAIKACEWKDADQGNRLVQRFVETANRFLPQRYMPDILTEENIALLPPMHRFAWWCTKAFKMLSTGDVTAYIGLLRKGLSSNVAMKPMVEFLMNQTPKPPSAELLTLAEQIRTILAAYPEDDPAVKSIKASDAYQKVANLIERNEHSTRGKLL